MIIIKCRDDINKIKNVFHQHAIYDWYFTMDFREDYDPSEEGWVVYIEDGDEIINLKEDIPEAMLFKETEGIYHSMVEPGIPGWEAVDRIDEMFNVLVLMNNEFGMNYFIPRRENMDTKLRMALSEESIK